MKNLNKRKRFELTILYIIISLILIGISLYKIISKKDLNAATIEVDILFVISILYLIYKIVMNKKTSKNV